jgi:hypothetical protein
MEASAEPAERATAAMPARSAVFMVEILSERVNGSFGGVIAITVPKRREQ